MSSYAKRMAQLSARIFGEFPINDRYSKNLHVIQRLQIKPVTKQVEYSANYYPRHQELDYLFLTLRDYGLYRDEHRDFNEEMERLRKLRGKGKKVRVKKEEPATPIEAKK